MKKTSASGMWLLAGGQNEYDHIRIPIAAQGERHKQASSNVYIENEETEDKTCQEKLSVITFVRSSL